MWRRGWGADPRVSAPLAGCVASGQGCPLFGGLGEAEGDREMLGARGEQEERAFFSTRPRGTCLSEAEVAAASIAGAEAAASTVAAAAAVATTTSEGEAAAAAAISGAAAEEDLDEGADVEALISSKTKDLQSVSSVSRVRSVVSLAVGEDAGSGCLLPASLMVRSREGKSVGRTDLDSYGSHKEMIATGVRR